MTRACRPGSQIPTLRALVSTGLLLSLLLGSGVAPLAAQAGTGSREDPVLLPDLVVTATRVPTERGRLPTPVTVITADELRAGAIRTVADALRGIPGLTVVRAGSQGSQTSVFMRGGESDFVKVLVDGVSVNEAGGAIDLADLSTDQVERIEVVRGPASVLYGSDAVSGVVQIFTTRGRGDPRLDIMVLGGQGERRQGDGRHGVMDVETSLGGAAGRLSYTVGGGRSWSAGTYPLNNENELVTGSARLGWNDGGGTAFSLTTRVSDGEFHFPTDGAGNLADENQALARGSWTASASAFHRLGERLEAQFQLGVAQRSQIARDDPDGPEDTGGVFASRYESDVTRRSADLRMSAALDRATLTLGSTHERIEGDLSYASESEFGPREATARYARNTSAVYLEALVEPAHSLQATLGVRTDHNDAFGRFDTYRVGFSWNALPATRIRGAIGRAFREPTFGENFGSGFGDLGNEELVPERTRSWEAGIERVAGPFTIAGTWFAQTFRDLIQFTFATTDPADPNYFNVGTAESNGVELAAEGSLGSLKLSGEYTFLATQVVDPGLATDATFVQGEPLLRRPRHSGGLSARVAHARASVSVGATLVGRRADVDFGAATAENGFVAPRVTLPGYGTFDLSAEALLPFAERIAPRLLLRVENILDAEYEGIRGFPAPGRIVRVGASVEVGG